MNTYTSKAGKNSYNSENTSENTSEDTKAMNISEDTSEIVYAREWGSSMTVIK